MPAGANVYVTKDSLKIGAPLHNDRMNSFILQVRFRQYFVGSFHMPADIGSADECPCLRANVVRAVTIFLWDVDGGFKAVANFQTTAGWRLLPHYGLGDAAAREKR